MASTAPPNPAYQATDSSFDPDTDPVTACRGDNCSGTTAGTIALPNAYDSSNSQYDSSNQYDSSSAGTAAPNYDGKAPMRWDTNSKSIFFKKRAKYVVNKPYSYQCPTEMSNGQNW